MRIFKLILKIFMWIAISFMGLLLLASILVYIPPIQNLIKDKASQIASNTLGMDLSIDRIRLRFPARLTVNNAMITTAQGDTLAHVGSISARASILPLLRGEIVIPRLKVSDIGANYRDSLSGMHLWGTVGSLTVQNTGVRLSRETVDVGNIALDGADISLDLGESIAAPDTIALDTTRMAWVIGLRRLDIDDVVFRMRTSPEITELTANITKGQLRELIADLGLQNIEAGVLAIDNGAYTYLTDTTTVATNDSLAVEEDEEASLPWTIRLSRLELNDNSARYGSFYGEPAEGFDPSHIEADNIDLLIDSVFNRGTAITASIASLALRERSGLEITEGKGHFSMDSSTIALESFELRTPSSHILADASADASLLQMEQTAKLSAKLSASVSAADALRLYPVDADMREAFEGKSISLDGQFAGSLSNISVGNLRAQMPGHIDLQAKGDILRATEPEKLAGNLSLSGIFTNLDFLRSILPDSLRNRIGFPQTMTLNGMIAATGNAYHGDLILVADSGRIAVNANVDRLTEIYKADLKIDEFPLGTFLPHDSLGITTLSLNAEGNGFDPRADNAAAEIAASIERFIYNGYDFSGIALDAALREHILSGTLSADNEALNLELTIDGELRDSLYAATLKGPVVKADIHAMGLTPDAFSISLSIDASASAQMTDSIYKADIALDSVLLTHGLRTEKIGLTTLKAAANRSSVTAELLSGDLRLNFVSPESIATLTDGFGKAVDRLMSQIDSLNIDMRPIGEELPAFRVDFLAERSNPLRDYLYTTGVDFNRISLSAGNGSERPIAAGMVINGLRTGGLTLDTLNVWLGQRDEKIVYGLRVRNRPGNIDQMAFIGMGGSLSGNTLSANLRQRDRADSTGFRFGITAQLLDSAVRATLTPVNPIFGYIPWTVNEDNYFTYHFDKRMEANLRLQGRDDNQFFRLSSIDYQNMPPGSIRLDMAGLSIGEALSLFPAPPPVEGVLSGNGTIGLSDDIIKGDVSLGINDVVYNGERIGDLSAQVLANTNENNLWNLDLYLGVNEKTALTAWGTYDIGNTGAIDMKVNMPELPLDLANPFLPADIARLSGTADGELNLSGTLDEPAINGGLGFKDTRIAIPMIGTTYRISNERITVDNGRVNLNGFGLIAPNNQKLSLDGSIDIRDFSAMRADLELFASNFEVVNAPRSGGSQVYGLAALDVDVSLRGLLDALVVRGDVNVLSRTDVYYTMRDSPLEIEDVKQDIVTFVSFAEEEIWAQADSVPLRRQSSIDVLVNVDIQDNVRATVNLSENGNNRMELIGDGALAFTMNSQGDTRLSGRYTLSGGTVVYKPPVISQKNFGIDDGSYVEWTGELANPSFNITATEATPISVTQDESTTTVVFDIIVIVSNNLENMAISFDLKAPNDNGTGIQAELENMPAEQRASKAMIMLITNRYDLEDIFKSQGGFDIGQQLGSFVSQELNQWARNNLKGVELSVGVDNVDEGGSSHTDYSYSVSKSLFDDRFKVTIGGSVTDNPAATSSTENIVDDIVLEYRLTKRDNMFIKVYRYNTQESILEPEVVETGAGFVLRKKMNRLRELFRLTPDPAVRRERQRARELRRRMREEERIQEGDPAKKQNQDAPMAGDYETDAVDTPAVNETTTVTEDNASPAATITDN